ncbi:MAG TPA: iron-sulfur cluster assembly accessory protein [Candidatus Binataceae bacterium]|nr:iron-sulfur cluster assembly accessory protein [Candidatus Binataceae bacterium]
MSEEVQQQNPGTDVAAAAGAATGVILTPKAIAAVRKMIEKEALGANSGLRIAVVGGGCSGFQYSLNFDDRKDGDMVTELDGVTVFVDEISLPYIAGITLDYVEGLHNAGFRFDNPRATRTCGCGSSFSA